MKKGQWGKGTFVTNWYRCPIYDYFKAQGEEEIFRKTWCFQDFSAAEAMADGGKYERPHLLSAGDEVCDMKWTVVPRKG